MPDSVEGAVSGSATPRWEHTTHWAAGARVFGELREYAIEITAAKARPGVDSVVCMLRGNQPIGYAKTLATCSAFVSRDSTAQVELTYQAESTAGEDVAEYTVEFSGPLETFRALEHPPALSEQTTNGRALEFFISISLAEADVIDGTETDILAAAQSALAGTDLPFRARAGGPQSMQTESTLDTTPELHHLE